MLYECNDKIYLFIYFNFSISFTFNFLSFAIMRLFKNDNREK